MVELKEEETSGWRDGLVVERTDYFLSEDPGSIPSTCTAARMSVSQACGTQTDANTHCRDMVPECSHVRGTLSGFW